MQEKRAVVSPRPTFGRPLPVWPDAALWDFFFELQVGKVCPFEAEPFFLIRRCPPSEEDDDGTSQRRYCPKTSHLVRC